MNKMLTCFILSMVFFCSNASGNRNVYTIVSDSTAPCYIRCPILGIYFDINIGYTSINLAPYRGDDFGLLPLNKDHIEERTESFIGALGYDFYPCVKVPIRLEATYFYADEQYKLNPIFLDIEDFFSNDKILVRNTLATIYFDWHTCTRLVPYIGVGAGAANIKTYHHPNDINNDVPLTHIAKNHNFSWGATIGTRYFFANYFFTNLQLRFSNLGKVAFVDNTPLAFDSFPQSTAYRSDYLHEATIMLGVGYVF